MSFTSDALRRKHDSSGIFPTGRIRERCVTEASKDDASPSQEMQGCDTTPNFVNAAVPTVENGVPHLVNDGEEGAQPQTVHDAPTKPYNVSAPPRRLVQVAISVPINIALAVWGMGFLSSAAITWMVAA